MIFFQRDWRKAQRQGTDEKISLIIIPDKYSPTPELSAYPLFLNSKTPEDLLKDLNILLRIVLLSGIIPQAVEIVSLQDPAIDGLKNRSVSCSIGKDDPEPIILINGRGLMVKDLKVKDTMVRNDFIQDHARRLLR